MFVSEQVQIELDYKYEIGFRKCEVWKQSRKPLYPAIEL